MKLFSPSLTRRKEPPSSMATVLIVAGKSAMVSFRGRTLTAAVLDQDENYPVTAGETLHLLEHPRGVFHVKRTGISWYANPIENWIKKGFKANATLEYFLRKCKKWSPLITGTDGKLLIKELDEGQPDGKTKKKFDELDKDKDGVITRDEWKETGGDEETFDKLDKDGDGTLTLEEFKDGTTNGPGLLKFDGDNGGGGGGTSSVWIVCTPVQRSTPGDVIVSWGSENESTAVVEISTGGGFVGTSGTATVTIPSTAVFTITGGSGATDSAVCYVGNVPGWNPNAGWMIFCNRTLGAIIYSLVANPTHSYHIIKPPSGPEQNQFEFWFGSGDLVGWDITGVDTYAMDPDYLAENVAALNAAIGRVASWKFKYFLKDGTTGIRTVTSASVGVGFDQYHRIIYFGPSSFTV